MSIKSHIPLEIVNKLLQELIVVLVLQILPHFPMPNQPTTRQKKMYSGTSAGIHVDHDMYNDLLML